MSSKRILVAEDSSVLQSVIRKILVQANQSFEIESAKDGKALIDLFNKSTYDLILLDINMPKMSGIECTKLIRADKDAKKSTIPIIAITGNAMNMSEDEFKSIGIDEFLPKPLNFDELVQIVMKYIG